MKNLTEVVRKLLANYYLCEWCLGRLFGGLSTGLTNYERGKIIIEYIKMDTHFRIINESRIPRKLLENLLRYYADDRFTELIKKYNLNVNSDKNINYKCYICNGLFSELETIVNEVFDKISMYEFRTFQIGIRQLGGIENREEEIKKKFGIWVGENIRNDLSREIGKALMEKIISGGGEVKYSSKYPELTIVINPLSRKIKTYLKPVEILVKAQRTDKKAPIFSMNCSECGGRGCEYCNYTGRDIGESFESLVGVVLLDIFAGDRWKFGIRYIDKEEGIFEAKFKIINPRKRYAYDDLIERVNNAVKKTSFIILSVKILNF